MRCINCFFSEETDLKSPLDSEAWLVRFLRPCKFYPESAFGLVSHIFSIVHTYIVVTVYFVLVENSRSSCNSKSVVGKNMHMYVSSDD